MADNNLPDIVDVLTVLKRFLAGGFTVDAETRERIETMSEDEVFSVARNILQNALGNSSDLVDELEDV